MPSDSEIARSVRPRPIGEIAALLGIEPDLLELYGRDKAKVNLALLERPRARPKPSRLILVSAITPTSAGEGKTTTTIGLGQAFTKLGESVCLALREPSLGPCMGVKGGATGGGYSQLIPADSINLHFTGDFHAITSAHNLLAALLDNHVHFDTKFEDRRIHPRRVLWRRVIDMNDRALRNVIIGLGGVMQGVPRETGFDITAASEVMAMLCLASGYDDLRQRLDRTLVGFTTDGHPVLAGELGGTGAMMALLKDALLPNLVQTLEGTPAFVHGGPFANIAHGCNSVFATRMAMHFADWTITEAGFGFDLGAEKFFDIKCRSAGLDPDAVVLVTTVRALKMHGGKRPDDLEKPDLEAVRKGMENLDKHIESVLIFGKRPVVALNRFHADSDAEIRLIAEAAEKHGVRFAESRHFTEGGAGATDLAREVIQSVAGNKPYKPLYDLDMPVVEKIRAVSLNMYGADDVAFTKDAEKDLKRIAEMGMDKLPICIAKAPSSLSDDPLLHGRPRDFSVTVRNIQMNAGAGFLVVLTGEIMRMPGLPKVPLATQVKFMPDGTIIGVG